MKVLRTVKWIASVAVVTGIAAGGYYGLQRSRRDKAVASLPTAPVKRGDFAELVKCRGEISAQRSVQLAAPRNIPDLRLTWTAEPGSPVKAGDIIARFDASGAERQLREQTAALKQASASLDQAVAQARMTAEQDKLDLSNARYEVEKAKLEASKQAIVSVLQGESSKVDLASAEAKLRVQLATVELHGKSDESKIASLRRQVEKAQADVDLTKTRIGQTELHAPGNGIIVFLMNYSQGWVNARPFKAGDQVWPGGAVAEIPDTSTLRMECKVDEVDRGRISTGIEARVHADALPEQTLASEVAAISPLTQVGFEWPVRRNFIAYAPIKTADSRLRPGMNGSADLVVRHLKDALSVPAKAVFTRNGKPVVYIADAKRYRAVPVEVLARNPDEVAVGGVKPGALVALAEPAEGERQ